MLTGCFLFPQDAGNSLTLLQRSERFTPLSCVEPFSSYVLSMVLSSVIFAPSRSPRPSGIIQLQASNFYPRVTF